MEALVSTKQRVGIPTNRHQVPEQSTVAEPASITRRRFVQLAVAGAALAATGVVVKPKPAAAAAPGYIPRLHGICLTDATFDQFADCMYRGEYNLKKVVTGYGLHLENWSDLTRHRVLWEVPGQTIVRTVTGAGGQPPYSYNGNLEDLLTYPNPDIAENEIGPWYAQRQDIWVEIGNEPNNSL